MMRYKPKLKYTYPEKTDQHMIKVPHIVDTNFNKDYNYFDDSKKYHFKRFLMNVFLYTIGYHIISIRHGLKIVGRDKLKKNKELFKDGAITICNHVFLWDYICVMKAIRPQLEYHLAWPINFQGGNRKLIKLVGGVPIPETREGLIKFNHAINDILEKKYWLHAFPEGSMWFYYPNIRPFKKGIFTYAHKFNRPVIPMAISFRKPKGIYKLLGVKNPQITLTIGDPELPNLNLSRMESIEELQRRCYKKVQILAGINENDPDYKTLTFEETQGYYEH